jgi:glycosyltransferase involved in cell wall biosynthesis
MTGRVAYVVRSWPRLSQTFVLNEVLAVERLGCELSIFAMVRSGEEVVQPQLAQVRAPVHYLEDDAAATGAVPRRASLGGVRAWVTARGRPRLAAGYATVSTATSLRLATRLADAIDGLAAAGRPVDHIHAHFAHDPALVAMFAHQLTGIPFSFTAHARDLYGVPPRALVARARRARAIVTCCQANVDHLHAQLPARLRSRVRLIHHGVDLSAFAPDTAAAPMTVDPPRIVSVGRLVEKKGFADLLAALARLRSRGVEFRCVVFGEGPMRPALEAQRRALGLDDVVELPGERRQHEVAAELTRAQLFALTPCVTADGDRDGVPNVLAEAMASGLAVVATRVGGIEDLVRHGDNGLLAPPHDVDAIADALGDLLADPARRMQLGAAARRTVEADFDLEAAASRLTDLFATAGRT